MTKEKINIASEPSKSDMQKLEKLYISQNYTEFDKAIWKIWNKFISEK